MEEFQKEKNVSLRGWCYKESGDYHKNLDPNWSYTPTYLRKMKYVKEFIESLPSNSKILDLACGEGVLVEEFDKKGMDIIGLDYNYESDLVRQGDARDLPFTDSTFDVVIFLDAFEHFAFSDQPAVLQEIYRVLKSHGQLMMTVPNLAHFNSRMRLLFKGELDRTDNELDHLGERPVVENRSLVLQAGFTVMQETGITFTVPYLYRQIICRHAARYRWLHDAMEPLAKMFSSLAMVNAFICQKSSYLSGQASHENSERTLEESPDQILFKINTHLKNKEKNLLIKLAASLGSNTIAVEVGHLGASSSVIAEVLRRNGGKLYVVDASATKDISERDMDTFLDLFGNTKIINNCIEPLEDHQQELNKAIEDQIDLLFIDGEHSSEGIISKLEMWLPKLKDNAIIVFDESKLEEEVQRVVRKLIIPIQIEPIRRLNSISWTRVTPVRLSNDRVYATVAIPTYKRSQYVIDCLNSVINQDTIITYEVIVLDNACDSSIKKVVESIDVNVDVSVRYIPVNDIGLHNGRNIAALEGYGEIIVYIDDDVIVPQKWLEEICKPFDDPFVSGVGGKTLPQWEVSPVPEWLECLPPSYFSLLDLGDEDCEMQWPQTPYGCNMAYRRSLVIEYDGFPPDSVGGGWLEWYRGDGETGFAKKIYADCDSNKLLYSSGAWLYHRVPINRTTLSSARRRAMKGAISSFYSEYRSKRYGREILIKTGLFNIYIASRKYIWNLPKRIMHPIDKWIKQELQVSTSLSLGLYQLRLAFDNRLRNWVIKDSYWPKKYTDIN